MGANLILPAGSAAAEEAAFSVDYSCRFAGAEFLKRTPSSNADLQTWTLAAWVKRAEIDSQQIIFGAERTSGTEGFFLFFRNTNEISCYQWNGSGYDWQLTESAKRRDTGAWMHISMVVAMSSAQSDRIKLFFNGERITAFSTSTLPSSALDTQWGASGKGHWIGVYKDESQSFYEGYLADLHFVDGAALAPDGNFIEKNDDGLLVPKEYDGTYGDNGFHLDFASAGTTSGSNTGLGKDVSGNENYFTTSSLASHDQLTDSPSAGRNHATWNPLTNDIGTLSEGNLKADGTDNCSYQSTLGLKSGKWQWEVYVGSGSYTPYMGVTDSGDDTDRGGSYLEAGRSFIGNSAYKNNTATTTVYEQDAEILEEDDGSAVFGFALDLNSSTKTLKFYKNGSLEHTDSTISGDVEYFPLLFGTNSGSNSWRVTVLNCGQDPTFVGSVTTSETEFAYPISGYNAIKAANLPDPGVNNAVDSEQAFEVITYEGTETEHTIPHSGTSPASMSFNPDLIWVKNRSNATGYHHGIADTVRGISSSSTPLLSSSSDGAEYDTTAQIEGVSSNQITLGDNSDSANYVNLDDDDYVAWAWKAGTGFSSTNGGDTTSGSKNADAGFSIVTWSGDDWNYDNGEYPEGETKSIYHGLGAAPELIIAKSLSNNASSFLDDEYGATYDSAWVVWTKDLSANTHLELDSASAAISTASGTYPDPIQSVGATTFGASNAFDDSNYVGYFLNFGEEENGYYYGDSYVAYCFRSIEGYSKVGSYTGNGLDNGPFVHLGFRPAFILIKNADANNNGWLMFDSTRSPHNAVGEYLIANSSADESDFDRIDFVSNGFKLRENYTGDNSSSTDYIFYAVAENPFKHANAR